MSVCLVRLTYPIGKAVDSQTLIELFTMITVLGYGELSRKKLNSISVFLSARERKPRASSDHFSRLSLSIHIHIHIFLFLVFPFCGYLLSNLNLILTSVSKKIVVNSIVYYYCVYYEFL